MTQVTDLCPCGHRIMYHSAVSGRTGCHQCNCRKTHKNVGVPGYQGVGARMLQALGNGKEPITAVES